MRRSFRVYNEPERSMADLDPGRRLARLTSCYFFIYAPLDKVKNVSMRLLEDVQTKADLFFLRPYSGSTTCSKEEMFCFIFSKFRDNFETNVGCLRLLII